MYIFDDLFDGMLLVFVALGAAGDESVWDDALQRFALFVAFALVDQAIEVVLVEAIVVEDAIDVDVVVLGGVVIGGHGRRDAQSNYKARLHGWFCLIFWR